MNILGGVPPKESDRETVTLLNSGHRFKDDREQDERYSKLSSHLIG